MTREQRTDPIDTPIAPGPVPFIAPKRTGNPVADDDALHAARAAHAWRHHGAPEAHPKGARGPDGRHVRCAHGSAFDGCVGCMTAAGVPVGDPSTPCSRPGSQADRLAHYRAELHGLDAPTHVPARVHVAPPSPQEQLSAHIRKRLGR